MLQGERSSWCLMENYLVLYRPDGERFKTYTELMQERDLAQQERNQAWEERNQERERAERLAARLRELGMDPDTI
jgi:hypothetical protein